MINIYNIYIYKLSWYLKFLGWNQWIFEEADFKKSKKKQKQKQKQKKVVKISFDFMKPF